MVLKESHTRHLRRSLMFLPNFNSPDSRWSTDQPTRPFLYRHRTQKWKFIYLSVLSGMNTLSWWHMVTSRGNFERRESDIRHRHRFLKESRFLCTIWRFTPLCQSFTISGVAAQCLSTGCEYNSSTGCLRLCKRRQVCVQEICTSSSVYFCRIMIVTGCIGFFTLCSGS